MIERNPRSAALAYLASQHVMTLATQADDDLWAAAVFYAAEGFQLYFLSAGHTRHASHLQKRQWAAGTIQADYASWHEIKGLQFEGSVVLLDGSERDVAIALYKQRFPFLQEAPPRISDALLRVNWYRLTPKRLYFVDNSVEFGHRDEIQL